MSSRTTWIVGWIAAALAIAAFASLGRWQVGRMHEKQALLEQVEHTLAARQARPLARAADVDAHEAFDWASGHGHFVDAPAVLLDNQMREGRAGVRAYRVFLPDQEPVTPLLVELGWLPLDSQRTLPSIEQPQGNLGVSGLLAPPPSAGLLNAEAQAQPDGSLLATTLDPQALAATLGQPGLAPRVLKLDPALPIGYERDLDVLPNTLPPEKHLGYAVQWFALALTVLLTAVFLSWRALRRRASP